MQERSSNETKIISIIPESTLKKLCFHRFPVIVMKAERL